MIGTETLERVDLAVVGDTAVPHFGVARAVERTTGDHGAPTDAGTNGDVDQTVKSYPRAPAMFAECRRVHVGVERDGQVECLPNWAKQVGIRPARFGRRGDIAVGWGTRSQVEGAERADSDGGQGGLAVMSQEEAGDLGQRFGRRRRRDTNAVANVVGPRAHGADDLAATGLYCAEKHRSEYCLGAITGCVVIDDTFGRVGFP